MILFCIPYAGVSEALYYSWRDFIDESIKVHQVPLNSRGQLFNKKFYNGIEDAVKQIFNTISNRLKYESYAIWVHNMGSLIAYKLYYKIKSTYLPLPQHIFLSWFKPPNLPRVFDELIYLNNYGFKNRLVKLGDVPEQIVENDSVLNGNKNDISKEEAILLREHSDKDFHLYFFEGSHFYLKNIEKIRLIAEKINKILLM